MKELANKEVQKFYDVSKELPQINASENRDPSKKIYKWGDDNLYSNYLASLFYSCALHGGIIRSKVHYTVSGGLNYEGANKSKWDIFFSNGNSDYNLDELSEILSKDQEVFNAYAYTITYVSGSPFQLDHVPFESLRKGFDGKWRYSKDWTDRKEIVLVYDNLDINNKIGKQLVVYMEKPMQIKLGRRLTKGIYPVPPYSGGILAIETDVEINNYRRNEIANNFSLGTIVNFNNGKPSDLKDENEILDNISATSQGTSNAGGVFATFNNGKDRETTIANMAGNNLDSRYLALSKDNKDNILLAHSVTTGLLFGVKTEGQLGGLTELEILYNLMKNGYFKYRQRAIASTFGYISNKLLGIQGEIFFNDVSIQDTETDETGELLRSLNNLNPLLQAKVLETLKENEIRSLIGLEAVEGGDSIPLLQPFLKSALNKEDPVVIALKSVGTEKNIKKIAYSRALDVLNFDEEGFANAYERFALNENQAGVLSLLNQNVSNAEISSQLSISNARLELILTELEDEGLIEDRELTTKGNNALIESGKAVVSIVYSYEVKAGLGAELIPTSREFCQEVVRANKFYTKLEIDMISQIVGRDVWTYKGGWYHNPKTDVTTTSCRHYWQQNTIIN